MREVHRSAILPYPAEAMFALIADLEAYPQFLPGCTASSILSRDSTGLIASLSLTRGPFSSSFTTRNTLEPPHRITMELVDGPFKSLHGEWQLTPLGRPAADHPVRQAGQPTGQQGCRIDLRVTFQFTSAARDLLLGPAFELTCSGLVDAFVVRAKAVYG
jgi:ribosome-associated toxin RatA of RatAB toxin-antitoxin module